MGNIFSYRVHLSIKHPSADPARIASELRRQAQTDWRAGEPRVTPTGRRLGGVRAETYCSFRVGEGDDGALAECLAAYVTGLEPHAAFLRELKASGGELLFYAFWHPSGDSGEIFHADLLSRLAALGIDLGINVYDDRQEPAD